MVAVDEAPPGRRVRMEIEVQREPSPEATSMVGRPPSQGATHQKSRERVRMGGYTLKRTGETRAL